MPVPSYVNAIKKSLDERKKGKEFFDSAITLSNTELDKERNIHFALSSQYEEKNPVRLLDEGAITYEGGDDIRLFIEKGSIQTFYDNLSDDFVGYINLAHIDISALPLNLGTWTKKDLTVVDVGDGRKALDVNVKLNRDLHIVQDLLNQEIPLSVSAELTGQVDWEASYKFRATFLKTVNIAGFSVVANPANVNSADQKLNSKGENKMSFFEKLLKEKENPQKLETEEKKPEETQEELKDETKDEEQKEEVATLSAEDTKLLNKFMDTFEQLSAKVDELEAENKELKEKLNAKTKEKTEFEKNTETTLARLNSLLEKGLEKEEKQEKLTNTSKKDGMWG